MFKKRKGLSIVEVILAITLFSLIVVMIYPLFSIGTRSHNHVSEEFEIQSNIRLTSQVLSNYIKKSSALFLHKTIDDVFTSDIFPESSGTIIIDDDFINNSTSKDDLLAGFEKYLGWNFIVLSENGKELREFTYRQESDSESFYYEMKRIFNNTGNNSINYDLVFNKNNSYLEDNLLEFNLIANRNGIREVANITSEVEALNSLQVVDRSDYTAPARVLFYRSDERPGGYDAKAAVAMVLDVSNSMDEYMVGSSTRLNIMQEKSLNLLNNMKNLEIDATLIPFASFAYNEWSWRESRRTVTQDLNEFFNVEEEFNLLERVINNLSISGGTNVGDGIRRAYYRFKDYNIEDEDRYPELEENNMIKNIDATKYLILLMDGVPTFGSVHRVNRRTQDYINKPQDDTIIIDGNNYHYYNRVSVWVGGIFFPRYEYRHRYYNYYNIEFVTEDYEIDEEEAQYTGTIYPSGRYAGMGNKSDPDLSKRYITEIAKLYPDIKNSNDNKNLRVYVIGFSDNPDDFAELSFIADQFEGRVQSVTKFEATNDTELDNVFKGIENQILEDYWHVFGPKE